jgi:hypothetical protein
VLYSETIFCLFHLVSSNNKQYITIMKKTLTVLFAFLLVAYTAWAQQAPVIEFKTTTHDFGDIKEEGGPQKYKFVFTNKGTTPLIVSNVNASCGCTTPGWTKEPVMPGKTGFVEAEYNPQGRPGAFNKSLTVTTNGNPATLQIYIKGNVTPKVKTVADEYPHKEGSIRLTSKYLNVGRVGTKAPVTQTFKFYNEGSTPLSIVPAGAVAKHMNVTIVPKTVQPKAYGEIKVTYNGKARNDFGYVQDALELVAGAEKFPLFITASVEDSPEKLTPEQAAKAPKLSLDKNVFDFGKIKVGEVINTEFVFTNSGKEELQIHKTKASCGCTASNPDKTVLKPGESSKIKVSFNSAGKKGAQTQSVTIYTNDPANPTQTISIKGEVQES